VWTYQGAEFTDDLIDKNVGFVYRITNLIDGKQYIGKKLFTFAKTKQVKGKKKKSRVESDWKSYFGSNKALIADVEKLGADSFKREILHLCISKGTCNYLELKEQILHSVMESELFYNEYIMVRINKSHIKLA